MNWKWMQNSKPRMNSKSKMDLRSILNELYNGNGKFKSIQN